MVSSKIGLSTNNVRKHIRIESSKSQFAPGKCLNDEPLQEGENVSPRAEIPAEEITGQLQNEFEALFKMGLQEDRLYPEP